MGRVCVMGDVKMADHSPGVMLLQDFKHYEAFTNPLNVSPQSYLQQPQYSPTTPICNNPNNPSLRPSHILRSSLPVRKTMRSSRFHGLFSSLSLQAESSLSDFSLLQCSTSDSLLMQPFNADSLSIQPFNADSLSTQPDADSLSIQPFNAYYLLLQSSSSDSLLEESSNDPHFPKQSSRHLIKSGKLGDKFFNFKLWRQLHQMGMETTN